MNDFYKEDFFNRSVREIYSLTNNSELWKQKLKDLEEWVLLQEENLSTWRLAYLFQNSINIDKLQNKILKSKSPRLLFNFAYLIDKSDKNILQDELFKTGDIFYIARFGACIKECDINKIFYFVKKSNNARAAYLLVKSKRSISAYEFKETFLRSKKPRYLYSLAFLCKDREELSIIEDLILQSGSFTYICNLANNVSNVNLKKIEDWVIKNYSIGELKRFAKKIKSDRLNKLSILF